MSNEAEFQIAPREEKRRAPPDRKSASRDTKQRENAVDHERPAGQK